MRAASSRYRSVHDPTSNTTKKFLLVDTPGHGKLRHHALASLTKPQNLKGLIFVVDAANLTAGSPGLREAAEYLHDLLLLVQKRAASTLEKGGLKGLPVLIAANKLDLFTALPAGMVKRALEAEISEVRASRARGLQDSGVGMDDLGGDPEKEWLGSGGEGAFDFVQLSEECDVVVTVEGGVAAAIDGDDVKSWWQWIGECL
jgi:signal recognition particle receptor subunit beta